MTDTPRSVPVSPGDPATAGKQPPAPDAPRPAAPAESGSAVVSSDTPLPGAPPPAGKPAATAEEVSGAPRYTPPPEPAGSGAPAPGNRGTTPYDATETGVAPGQPVYGPPGTGPDPNTQVYGHQMYGTGIPGRLDIGHALSYGLEKFKLNPGPWVAVTSLGLIIYLVFYLVVRVVEPSSVLGLFVIFAAVMAGLWLLQAAMVRGALYETDGYRPGFGSYFYLGSMANAFLTALLAFLATTLASALCLIPGIVVGIGCMFSLHFAIEQGQSPVEAIKSSFLLVLRDPWRVLLLVLTVVAVTALGLLACGFGLLAAGPVAVIAVTYAYRTLTGGPVSPV
ncbi:hypothetical protein [Nocardia jinanensis]|uniref:Integral membrane protein n=1 Tax=Nocardia jinanensis TaxID=382504 RepID=A0A917R7Z1_9NOCA|nr:hypothetical protein [Nocardia jinanensis]GGK93916.1 hypothetical protein GCM10011588_05590 [Nocardia jinanensis]